MKYLMFFTWILTALLTGTGCSIHEQPASQERYAFIDKPIFAPDSKHVAFRARLIDDDWTVVVDGVEHGVYDFVDSTIVFSNNSQRVAFRARRGNGWLMVVDGTQEKAYDYVEIPIFSPDSSQLAYRAREGNAWVMVINGAENTYRPGLLTPDSDT